MLKSAHLDGFFTNHSLRRSGTTRLFQAGVDRKIIKEFTGHTSDAVDNYQVTSHEQKRQMSEILAGEYETASVPLPIIKEQKVPEPMLEKESSKISSVEVKVKDTTSSCGSCTCKLSNVKLEESEKIGQIVSQLLKDRRYSKATIKLEVEFSE